MRKLKKLLKGKKVNMWIVYALLTIVFYVAFDFFLKKSAGIINDYLAIVIINALALAPALLVYLWLKLGGREIYATKEGFIFSLLAGVSVGLASLSFIKVFSVGGAGLSLGSPVVRVGMVLGALLIGIFVLKESVSTKQIIGFILSVIGVYLLMFK